jgi:hypothetical protein
VRGSEDARVAEELQLPVSTPVPDPLPTPADLPAPESLTPDSDFTRFMRPDVPAGARNAAVKKLFADPHFNVMDGLDIYIDDYTKPDPIPLAMLKELAQSRMLGLFDTQDDAEPPPAGVVPMPADAPAPATDAAPLAHVAAGTMPAVAAGPAEPAGVPEPMPPVGRQD